MSDVTKFEGDLQVDAGYVLAIGSTDKKIAGGTASASGASTIAHGLSAAPDYAQVTASVSGHIATISSVDASNITIDLYSPAGNQVTAAETVYWMAIGDGV